MNRKMNISKDCKTATKAYTAAGGSSAALAMRLSKAAAALLVLTLIFLMTAASALSVFAEGESGENNGADAHSGSMSAGSGQNPIADESTTWDYGQDEEDTFADDEESEDAEVLYYDEEFDEDEAAGEDEAMEEDEADVPADDLTKRLVLVLICSVVVLAGAVAAILAVMRMEKRSQ